MIDMMRARVFSVRRPLFAALVGGVVLVLTGTSGAVAAGTIGWQGMLEGCHRAMAAMGIHLSPGQLDAMRSMMAGCTGMGR